MNPAGQEAATSGLERVLAMWGALALGYKIALIGLVAGLVIWGIVRGVIRMGRSGRRHLLVGSTVVFLLAAVGFSTWSLTLPEPVGTYFVLWHQVIRVCAAVFTTLFIITAMGLAIPIVLNRIEAGSAVGEGAFFTRQPRSATVQAASACKIWSLSPIRFTELSNRQPQLAMEVAMALGSLVSRRLANRPKRVAVT